MEQDTAKIEIGSPITDIRNLARHGQIDQACQKMEAFLSDKFSFKVVPNSLVFDLESSVALNSLRAAFKTECGQHLFLKCHHEDGEGDRVGEYYRAGILENAGFPIDVALYQASEVGEQLVIYSYQDRQKTPELHDVARELEAQGCPPDQMEPVIAAYDAFQKQIGELYIKTLHIATREELKDEAIHALFHRRLVDQENDEEFGARVKEFYLGRMVMLPDGITLPFEEFWQLRWQINGLSYDMSLQDAFISARKLLKPSDLFEASVTAHGDDHTANVLYSPDQTADQAMKYFDPAFAGHHIPALQAGCKALYHVIFAHPNMLYDPDEFEADVKVSIQDDKIILDHDWDLTPLRSGFLESQKNHIWIPLLQEMKAREVLPDGWEDVVRSTLFCCPVVCKNLIAGAGAPNPLTPLASLMSFAISKQLACAPQSGADRVSEFFTAVKSAL